MQSLVDEYQDRVLDDYQHFGIMVRFEQGRAQMRPALKLKGPHTESDYYYARGDRRRNKGWVTVKRDFQGLRADVEMFHRLLERGAGETDMHRFFEEHPAILMEARMGIPISHGPRFDSPAGQTPDFSVSPIIGPYDEKMIELLELKGPTESTLTKGLHGGFTAKITGAVNQVRDYDRYLRSPANLIAVERALGYVPDASKLAVLIGRAPKEAEKEMWERRRSELNVEVVTYDEILATQANQLGSPLQDARWEPGEYPFGGQRIKIKRPRT